MHGPIQVLVVDDEPRLRMVWGRVIESQPDMVLVTMLESADALDSELPDGPCVVLLDLSMPGRDPLDVAAQVNRESPDCRIIIYSGYSDPDTMQAAADAGAWGFVDKLASVTSILEAIRRVAGGEAVFGVGSSGL
jgi:two-component system response regulator DesR